MPLRNTEKIGVSWPNSQWTNQRWSHHLDFGIEATWPIDDASIRNCFHHKTPHRVHIPISYTRHYHTNKYRLFPVSCIIQGNYFLQTGSTLMMLIFRAGVGPSPGYTKWIVQDFVIDVVKTRMDYLLMILSLKWWFSKAMSVYQRV